MFGRIKSKKAAEPKSQTHEEWLAERNALIAAYNEGLEELRVMEKISEGFMFAWAKEMQAEELGYAVEAADWRFEREFYGAAIDSIFADHEASRAAA